jgi:hypothetical protein
MAPELQGGLIGVEGFPDPTAAKKHEFVEAISHYLMDGWAIAADPTTPIGRLAALNAETACMPFVNLTRIALVETAPRAAHSNPASCDLAVPAESLASRAPRGRARGLREGVSDF